MAGLSPCSGPVLGPFRRRCEALKAERKWMDPYDDEFGSFFAAADLGAARETDRRRGGAPGLFTTETRSHGELVLGSWFFVLGFLQSTKDQEQRTDCQIVEGRILDVTPVSQRLSVSVMKSFMNNAA